MVQGTGSDVGKSLVVAGLCRLFADRGLAVRPFKPQNMSNNAAVTVDGGEIGRAQALQAKACRTPPRADMNPVLLKPQGERTAQVVVRGQAQGTTSATGYRDLKPGLMPHVLDSFARIEADAELIIAEGAGSPAETNLYARDIVNMAVARYAGAPTILVGDIDRGGVFAHFVGTLALLAPADRALVRGLIINRFRGDPVLLEPAIRDVEARTGVPVLGVIPWIDHLDVAQEDAVVLERGSSGAAERGMFDVAVIQLPRIANFDDFDPLAAEPGVRVRYVERPEDLGEPGLLVIPGTKATIADLEWLRASGLDEVIRAHAARGGAVLGVCGGMQMLGERLLDPGGVEAAAGSATDGLGLLSLETTFVADKTTRRARGHIAAGRGHWSAVRGHSVEGYEIHMGRTTPTSTALDPLLVLDGHEDGAVSLDGRIAGTYLHGLFTSDAFRRTLLRSLGWRDPGASGSAADRREREFDRLAGAVREHLDLTFLRDALGLTAP